MGYEITFVGTSGGPSESGNCAIMIKPASISYTEVLESRGQRLFMFDAGSGWHALAEIILNEQNKRYLSSQLSLYEDALQPQDYLGVPMTRPFSHLRGLPLLLSRQIFSKVAETLISHPHLDHIQSMVLNSAGVAEAGKKTVIFGSQFTTDALNKHIFNGVVWPDLVSLGFVDLYTISPKQTFSIAQGAYDVTFFEVSHGQVANKGCHIGPYQSSAFLVCDATDQSKLLVFGDFEADSISGSQKNSTVWQHVAPYVLDNTLKGVILECSTCSLDASVNLYGHMTPTHVMTELQKLEALCGESASDETAPFVKNLKVFITHVKDTYDGKDPRKRILSELQQLSKASGLELNFSIVTNGVSVVV